MFNVHWQDSNGGEGQGGDLTREEAESVSAEMNTLYADTGLTHWIEPATPANDEDTLTIGRQ